MLTTAKQSLSGVCAQAQAEVAQLQSQLQDAVSQQEALQEALHDMQSTIAVLREQIQQQAEGSSACDAGTHSQHGHQQRGSTAQLLSQATPASALVQALQQQVEDLKEISACLNDSQQQQHMKHQPARANSLDSPATHSRACRGMAGNLRGLAGAHTGMMGSPRGWSAAGATLKHDCMMPPPAPRSMPNRRLPMSAYASPASQPASPRNNAIKAHHPPSHSAAESAADDKCWCGRPKKLTGSVVATPLRHGTTRLAARTSPAVGRGVTSRTSPGRPDRSTVTGAMIDRTAVKQSQQVQKASSSDPYSMYHSKALQAELRCLDAQEAQTEHKQE
ncbi:hypothetical protein ABBQ38_004559 [Trebouxia sp. C0009 RCD-2024]